MRPRMCDVNIRCSRRSIVRQRLGSDFVEATQISRQRVRFAFHGMGAEVLEEVVVRVHAIERGVGRMGFAQIAEQIVDEVREWFRCNH